MALLITQCVTILSITFVFGPSQYLRRHSRRIDPSYLPRHSVETEDWNAVQQCSACTAPIPTHRRCSVRSQGPSLLGAMPTR